MVQIDLSGEHETVQIDKWAGGRCPTQEQQQEQAFIEILCKDNPYDKPDEVTWTSGNLTPGLPEALRVAR